MSAKARSPRRAETRCGAAAAREGFSWAVRPLSSRSRSSGAWGPAAGLSRFGRKPGFLLRREALAAAGAAGGDDVAAADRLHARPETMAALADELAWLIGSFHCRSPLATRLLARRFCSRCEIGGLRCEARQLRSEIFAFRAAKPLMRGPARPPRAGQKPMRAKRPAPPLSERRRRRAYRGRERR